MRSLLLRTLFEKRWFTVGWSAAFGVMGALILMFYPSFSSGGGFDEVAASLPSQLQGFIGDPSIFSQIDGFIALQVYDVRMSLMLLIMCLILAISLSVREEESGELRGILTTSMSRTRVGFEKLCSAFIIICITSLASTIGVYVGLFAVGETAPHLLLWQLFGLTCLFGLVSFIIPFAIGLASGKRGITLFSGIIIALGSYLLTTFSRAVEWLQPWDVLSVIHYYDTAGLRENNFSSINLWVYSLIILLCVAIGQAAFRRRDIA